MRKVVLRICAIHSVANRFVVALILFAVSSSLTHAQSEPTASEEALVVPLVIQDNVSVVEPVGTDGSQSNANYDAMALRLTRIEQLLRAQQNIQLSGRNQGLLDIVERLDKIEASLAKGGNVPQTPNQKPSSNEMSGSDAADLRMYLNALAESSRVIQGQTDEILRRIQKAEEDREAVAADAEFRFQAIEGRMRQEENLASAEPQIIGTVAPMAPITGTADVIDEAAPLVGETIIEAAPTNTPLADPAALYERGLGLLRAGKYEEARTDFRQLVADFPQHARAGNAQYWLGETYYVERNFKSAAEAFLSGYSKFERSSKAPDSLLKLGMTLIAMGEKETGCDAFAELSVKFPNATESVRQRTEVERKRAACK